jgi:transposase
MSCQEAAAFRLESRWVGGLPLVNAVLRQLAIEPLLQQAVPVRDPRVRMPPAQVLGVLLRNLILNQRQPLYTQGEWAARADPALLGLPAGSARRLSDDQMGRALDQLFRADRASLLTRIVVGAVRTFQIELDQLHNDSTTVTFAGDYAAATGAPAGGRPTLRITHGHNKDHRPDLKQLLFVLTVSADGTVPVHYRALDGQTSDVVTHVETWNTLRQIVGRPDFLYVADSKLCSRESLAHLASQQGRFITVLPRTRREDGWFRHYLQDHDPPWQEVVRRPNPRRRGGAEDVWRVVEAALPSAEGYRVIWVWNSLMAWHDADSRQARIEKAWLAVEQFQTKLAGPRCRYRNRARVEAAVQALLTAAGAAQWVTVTIEETEAPVFRQARRGHPGPQTPYLRTVRSRFQVRATTRTDLVEQEARTDGMFPLLTNTDLTPAQILEAYKAQPRLEKRFAQLKSVQAVTPVWLKSATRVEALLFLYFLALLIQALLERQLRQAMTAAGIDHLPLYPEERECRAPSAERLLEVFASLQRHDLWAGDRRIQTFQPELDSLQEQIVTLLEMHPADFTT